jgi:hypothetical protein
VSSFGAYDFASFDVARQHLIGVGTETTDEEILNGTCASQAVACSTLDAPLCGEITTDETQPPATYDNFCELRAAVIAAAGPGSRANGTWTGGACTR